MNKKSRYSQLDSFSGSEVKTENSVDTNENKKINGVITMNKKEYITFEEELEMLRNEYVTKVTYKVVEEELTKPSEEHIELLTDKAAKVISDEGIIEVDECWKIFIREMVEGAIDNIF